MGKIWTPFLQTFKKLKKGGSNYVCSYMTWSHLELSLLEYFLKVFSFFELTFGLSLTIIVLEIWNEKPKLDFPFSKRDSHFVEFFYFSSFHGSLCGGVKLWILTPFDTPRLFRLFIRFFSQKHFLFFLQKQTLKRRAMKITHNKYIYLGKNKTKFKIVNRLMLVNQLSVIKKIQTFL